MRLEPFVCQIVKISYNQLKYENKYTNQKFYCKLEVESFENSIGESIDKYKENPNIYNANVIVEEKTQGRKFGKRKKLYNINLWISKEQFENKVLDIGDRIRIKKGKLVTDPQPIIIYDFEKIKEYPKRYITRTEKGLASVKLNIIACKISVEENGWELVKKCNMAYYFNLSSEESKSISKIHFYVKDKKELLEKNNYDFYLEKEEAEQLSDYSNKLVDLSFKVYGQTNQKGSAEMKISYDEKIDTYFATFSNIIRF